jgi:hypothetical protein
MKKQTNKTTPAAKKNTRADGKDIPTAPTKKSTSVDAANPTTTPTKKKEKTGSGYIAPDLVLDGPTATPEPTAAPVVELVKDSSGKGYVSKTAPDSKYHLRDRSDCLKPVAVVHKICSENPKAERKAIIELCLAAGVNKNTAATQYSHWKRKQATVTTEAEDGDGEGNEE